MSELTLSQALQLIEAKHKTVEGLLACMTAAEWHTKRGLALCNREQALHAAMWELRELAEEPSDQAANVADSQ